MPLPTDLSDDPKPMVIKDDDGNMIVSTRDGLAATFKDGRWQSGYLFAHLSPSLRSYDDFYQVTNEQERERILVAAVDALREWKRQWPD